MEDIRNFMGSEIALFLSFLSLLTTIIGIPMIVFKYAKMIKKLFSNNKTQSAALIFIIFLIGIIAPVFLIFKSSEWSGFQFWLTQFLSWYCIISFIALIFIVIKFK